MTEIEICSTLYCGMDRNGWFEKLTNKGYRIDVDRSDEVNPKYYLVIPESATWDYLLKLRHDIDNEIILTTNFGDDPLIEIYDHWRE